MTRVLVATLLLVGCATFSGAPVRDLFEQLGYTYPVHLHFDIQEPIAQFHIDEGERPAPAMRPFIEEGLSFARRTLNLRYLHENAASEAVAFTVGHPELIRDSTGQPQISLRVSAFIIGRSRHQGTIPSRIHEVSGTEILELQNRLLLEKVGMEWRVAGWVF